MAKLKKLFERTRNNPKDVRFDDICKLAGAFGFARNGGQGSHRFFVRPDVPGVLNFQDANGKAKPYQVRQFLELIDKFGLKMED